MQDINGEKCLKTSNVIILFCYSFIIIIPLHIVGGISGCVDWTWWALPCRRKLWRTHVPVGTDHTAPSTHHNLPCDYKTHRKYFKTARSREIKHFSQIQIIRYYFNVLPDFGNLSCKKAIQRKLTGVFGIFKIPTAVWYISVVQKIIFQNEPLYPTFYCSNWIKQQRCNDLLLEVLVYVFYSFWYFILRL